MTRRLYYHDSYCVEFQTRVVETAADPFRVYLEESAFYPTSGGQPNDTGSIGGIAVVDVIDEGERIAHLTAAAPPTGMVECRVDWARRFDHMQQHTGQHMLSAVLAENYGISTVSFHLGAESSTIDVNAPTLAADVLSAAERRVNELIWENRPVAVSFADSAAVTGLRKASEREGTLRIVSIEGLDRSACGGTHVRRTGEVGLLQIRRLDKIRGNLRIEFLCGGRAQRRAAADFQLLSQTARILSAAVDEVPALVAAQSERLAELDKQRRRLALEIAQARGRELYRNTPPEEATGLITHTRRLAKGSLDEELRAEAQAFTAQPNAIFLAVLEDPPSLLLAASRNAPLQAGATLKHVLAACGGRGGGTPQMAQGSVATVHDLDRAVRMIVESLPR